MRTTPEQRAELMRLHEAATKPPWKLVGICGHLEIVLEAGHVVPIARVYKNNDSGGPSQTPDQQTAFANGTLIEARNALPDLLADLKDLEAENARLLEACIKTEHEVQQILGKALGYPWYKDDPQNWPNATESDGVCVGEHVAASLAMEAADCIKRLREALRKISKFTNCQGPGCFWCKDGTPHPSTNEATLATMALLVENK